MKFRSYSLILQLKMEQTQLVKPQHLIIIITTSPIKSNPVTEVIDMAITSIQMQPTLALIPIYIICDGVKLTQQDVCKYKSGIVSQKSLQDYQAFKVNLRAKYGSNPLITIEERTQRYCFAQNIRHVMNKISQPFVMIFQHDHIFKRVINFVQIVNQMMIHSINYVGFMNKSVLKAPHELDQCMEIRKYLAQKVGYQPGKIKHDHEAFKLKVLSFYKQKFGLPLLPLLFWYDKVHIAKRSFYLDVIFNQKGFFDESKQIYMKTVSFVQDSYGTSTKKSIRKRPQKLDEVAAFILWDSLQSAVVHSHGRLFLTQQTRQQLYLKHLKQKDSQNSQSQQQNNYDLSLLNEDLPQYQ